MRHHVLLIYLLVLSCKNQSKTEDYQKQPLANKSHKIEVITLLGDTLFTPETNSGKAFQNFLEAQKKFKENPENADAIIWYGRRTAYLGRFQDAIEIYSKGIEKYPQDARFYRHRGHRYISTRQYDKAISDFEKAIDLVEGQPDQIEPDGLPNQKNIPLSTLKGNIWYHLGLAHYLNGDMNKALTAYQKREVTNRYDDNVVSGGHWLYMILKRLGKGDEANKAIEKVHDEMDIIENTRYYHMCLFYKGLITEERLEIDDVNTSSNDVYLYGLGNWYLYEKNDTLRAKSFFKRLLDQGNVYSFAYLAAESDFKRLFGE